MIIRVLMLLNCSGLLFGQILMYGYNSAEKRTDYR